jgi:O-antigen/teichoic acid export membrane protein/glycosyltransferase involved in cell wall biosynthesis
MSLKRNTLYNLVGALVPMAVGMVAVPIYLHKIGDARYGVLAIVWLFLGYFGLFDPGITRAATYHIARLSEDEQNRERESVFWTAILLNACFGIVGGLAVYFVGKPIFMSTFKMPEGMRAEVMASLPWLAASVPVSIIIGVLGGALQARERFGLFNTISSASALVTQLVPLAVAVWWSPNLHILIPAVLLSRTVSAIPMAVALIRVMPLGVGGRFERALVKPLFSYGGWITLTNLLNPVLTSLDRVLIGSVLSAEAVAFYSVPFNLVTRASIIPGALSTSLFPRLSKSSEAERARLAGDSVIALAAVMTPLIVISIACLPIFMHYWVGAEFSRHAASVGVVLLVGMWANGLAFIPYEHLQATNRPDLVAKFHAIEVIPFLGILWVGLHSFGLMGAAWAWTLRVVTDGLLLFWVAGKITGWQRILPGGLLVLLASGFAPTSVLSTRSAIEIALIAVSLSWSWWSSPIFRRLVTGTIPARFKDRSASAIVAVREVADVAPTVSIAMATYNGSAYILEQLESLAAQSLQPSELVITDDGSTDDTLQIIEEFARTVSFPVRVLPNSTRLGYANNFLRAASLCTGDLISFCDQDDLWLPNKLELCVAELRDPRVLLVVHSAELFGDGVPSGKRVPDYSSRTVFAPLGYYPLISSFGFAMVFRRELLEITDNLNRPLIKPEGGKILAHDQWIWFMATCFGKLVTLPNALAHYRQHSNNTFGADMNGGSPALKRYDYSTRTAEETRAAEFLAEVEKTCSERWRSEAGRAATFFRRCASTNFERASIYAETASLPRRVTIFARILLSGGYSIGTTAAWLGWRAMAKDLVLGVLRLR